MKKIVITISVLFLLPKPTLATPSVSGVSGNLTHGSSVTVSGSGFGTKTKATPQLWDTVENQLSYGGLSDGSTVPVGGSNPWPANQNELFKLESIDQQHGTNSQKCYKGTGTGVKFNDKVISNTGKIYIAWWFKPSKNPNTIMGDGHSSKFLRLSNSSDPVNRTFSWTQMHNYVYRTDEGYCQQGGGCYWEGWSGTVGQWNFHEVYMDGKSRNYKIMVNGNILTDGIWDECTAFDFDEIWGLGWDSDGAVPISMTIWLDDIYIDNTPQRIMACSGSAWISRNHCEIQIPTVWGASSINISSNQGSFMNGQQVYLYVVDSTGAVNTSGYPVMIEQVWGDATAPESPVGLNVR